MFADLKGKAVLITGASTGIGAATATMFGSLGARVGVHFNKSEAEASKVVSAISASGGEAALFQADIVIAEAVAHLIEAFVAQFGRIDVLVNNAGDMGGRRPFVDVTDSFYDHVLDLNVRPVVAGCSAAFRQFRKQGSGGSIINTTSVAARSGGGPGAQLYASSKAFVLNLTRGLAREGAAEGIRVNAVAPGVIDTPFHQRNSRPEQLEVMRKGIPMGRLGRPEDCAGAYLFLASDALSGFITGQTIEVNGGQLMP